MENKVFKIALAGNPNCGKTTIFNRLTGTRQHVGNYPGVTVERKTGFCRIGDFRAEIIDLPGIYSLASSSPEEKVAFQELLNDEIDLILNVIDAGNAQRNMYLTTQLTELDIPMLLAFNMIDDAEKQGLVFDFGKLEQFFGAPIVTTVGSSGQGIDELKNAITEIRNNPSPQRPVKPKYGPKTDQAIRSLTAGIAALNLPETRRIPARYFAIKVLEDDPEICARPDLEPFRREAEQWRRQIAARNGINSRTLMADVRYGVIAGACREAITISNDRRRQLSDVIDKYVTNRFLGVPIFLVMMYLVFQFTFTLGQFPMDYLEAFFGWLGESVTAVWPAGEAEFGDLHQTPGLHRRGRLWVKTALGADREPARSRRDPCRGAVCAALVFRDQNNRPFPHKHPDGSKRLQYITKEDFCKFIFGICGVPVKNYKKIRAHASPNLRVRVQKCRFFVF